jgi:hypothetical protein
MPKTPELLIQSTTRHAAFVERLKSHDVNVLLETLAEIERQFIGRLALDDLTEWGGRKRVEKQLAFFGHFLEEKYQSEIIPQLTDQAKEFGFYEAEFEVKNLANVAPTFNFSLPSETQMWAAVTGNPLSAKGPTEGQLLESFIKDWTNDQIKRSVGQIRAGYAQGLTNSQVIANLAAETLPLNRRGLAALTRTALQHSAQQARNETFRENSDIVRGVRLVVTLDSRTSTICRTLGTENRVYPIDEGPRPPFHINCRTSTIAALDERFSILDKDATRSARDPQTGRVYSEDANQTYYGWLKNQPGKVQDAIVGPTRGKLLRDGGLTSQRFAELQLNKRWEPATLAEIRAMEPLAFERAKL